MKTYVLGNIGDRILTVKKAGGEPLVTIKLKDDASKFIELTPKRLVFIFYVSGRLILEYLFLNTLSPSLLLTHSVFVFVTDGQHFVKAYPISTKTSERWYKASTIT